MLPNLRRKSCISGKISFGSMEGIDVNINGGLDSCNPVCDGRGRNGGGE